MTIQAGLWRTRSRVRALLVPTRFEGRIVPGFGFTYVDSIRVFQHAPRLIRNGSLRGGLSSVPISSVRYSPRSAALLHRPDATSPGAPRALTGGATIGAHIEYLHVSRLDRNPWISFPPVCGAFACDYIRAFVDGIVLAARVSKCLSHGLRPKEEAQPRLPP